MRSRKSQGVWQRGQITCGMKPIIGDMESRLIGIARRDPADVYAFIVLMILA